MKPSARNLSFPIVSSSSKDTPGSYQRSITYILVHHLQGIDGPGGVSYDYQLRSWLREVGRRNRMGGHVAYVFPFQILDLLTGGGSVFERLRQKLYRKIEIQPWSSWSAVTKPAGTGKTVTGDSAEPGTEPVTSSPVRPSIIFLCHGVGTWLVKDMLSRDCGNFVAVNTLSIMPLDPLEFAREQPVGMHYVDSIKKYLQVFRLGEADNTSINRLSKLLEKADARFAKLEEYIQEVEGLHKLPNWVSDPIPMWTLDPTPRLTVRAPNEPLERENNTRLCSALRILTAQQEVSTRFRAVKQKVACRFARILRRRKKLPNQEVLDAYLEAVLGKLDDVRCPSGPATHEEDSGEPIAASGGTEIGSTEPELVTAIPVDFDVVHHSTCAVDGPDVSRSIPRPDGPRSSGTSVPMSTSPYSHVTIIDAVRGKATETPSGELEPPEDIPGDRELGNLATSHRDGPDLPRSYPNPDTRPPPDTNSKIPSISPFTSNPPPPTLEELRRAVQEQRLRLLKGSYKDSAEAIISLKDFKKRFEKGEKRTIHAETVEGLTELIRLIARCLVAARGDYWEAAVELLQAPSLLPINLKRDDVDPMAAIVNSATALGDLALLFACMGFFTRASSLIRLLLKSIDHTIEDTRSYKHHHDIDKIPDRSIDRKEQQVMSDLMTKRISVAHIAADIYRSAGDYRGALKLAEQAWLGLFDDLGTEHARTYEVQVLRAELLGLNSQAKEAEAICYRACQRLSAKRGPRHPQTLEALRTLVFIFRTQYKLIQAIDTGRSLCEITDEATNAAHPQKILARAEFARCLVLVGQYKAAESECNHVIESSHRLYAFNPDHPETLLYQSELARVYLCLGRPEKAEHLAVQVLKGQHHAYQYERSQMSDEPVNITLEKPPRSTASYSSDDVLLDTVMKDLRFELAVDESLRDVFKPDQDGQKRHSTADEQGELVDRFSGRLRQSCPEAIQRLDDPQTRDGLARIRRELTPGRGVSKAKLKEGLRNLLSRLRVHPWLLQTIQLLVDIYIQQGPGGSRAALACEMANMVLLWRVRTLGQVHDLTLSAKYKLALAIRNTGDNHKAQELLRELYQYQALYFEDNHPEMLEVKRELIMTNVAADKWQDPDTPLSLSTNSHDGNGENHHTDEKSDKNDDDSNESMTSPPAPDASATTEDTGIPTSLTPEDWGAAERHSVMAALALEARMGANHPETLQTYLWILAVQLMVGKMIEASQTLRLIVDRTRHKDVINQRPVKALQMLEHAAIMSMEANLVADGLDTFDEIVNQGKELLGVVDRTGSGRDSSSKLMPAGLAEDEGGKIRSFVTTSQDKINEVVCTGAETALENMRKLYDLYTAHEGGAGDGDILIANALRFASRAQLSADKYESVQFLRSDGSLRFRILVQSLKPHFEGELDGKKWKAGHEILDNAFRLWQSTSVDNSDALKASKKLHLKLRKTLQDEERRRKRMVLEEGRPVSWYGPPGIVNGAGTRSDGENTTSIIGEVVEQCLEFSQGLERPQVNNE